MVTIRQFSSGVTRSLRAMERESRRAERQRYLHQQAVAKQTLLDSSAQMVADYEGLIDHLTRCHQIPFSRRDWAEEAALSEPADPEPRNAREQAAAAIEAAYRPNWFENSLGLAARKRELLKTAIVDARQADRAAHISACEQAKAQRSAIIFAKSVLALRSDALIEAVRQHANLNAAAIEAVNIRAVNGRVIVVADALEVEDMPTESVSLLKSGKASYKQLTQRKVLELHRDNVCSSAIRVAIEFLSVLPVEAVEIVMEADLLDPATGHITPHPVFYARITAQALEAVNLQMAEAAPLAERLGAQFSWNSKDGLRPLDLARFDLPADMVKALTTDQP